MLSFLIEITSAGRISEIHWSELEVAPLKLHGSVYELFHESAAEALQQAIRRCSRGGEDFLYDTSLKLKEHKSSVVFCMAPMDKKMLVFVAEDRKTMSDVRIRDCMGIVRNFMHALKASGRSSPANMQTDMIQTLAKELINRKRQMQDINAKMNLVNEDLNNRLVKDALTGLVSRYQYRTEIEYVISRNPRKLGVFVFIDVDNFKRVNDRYGHAVGDKYLVEFAERLKRIDVENAVCMRISGDEFGIFIYGMEDITAKTLQDIWLKIKHAVLSRPIAAGGYDLPIAISAGMSVYGIDTLDIYELIEYADFAMYTVKRGGKNNYGIFNRDEYHRAKQ